MTAYASTIFSEYMYKYLNFDLQPAYYNTFIAPGNAAIDFWQSELATPDPATLKQRFNELIEFIDDMSFKPLYGAPGIYIINLVGNTEPYAEDLAAYLALGETPVINLYVCGINQFALTPDAPGNPLTNLIDSINFSPATPDAILWDA